MIDLHTLFDKPPRNDSFYIIVIDGRGASGKSHLAELLAQRLDGFVVINGDDYFEPSTGSSAWGEFNEERFRQEVIGPLQVGARSLTIRPFEFDRGIIGEAEHLQIEGGVIVERCYSFSFDLGPDLRVWVETPQEICLARGLDRDQALGQRAIRAWTEDWQPREAAYIAASSPSEHADVVVDGTQPFELQLRQS
ncbi:MAG: hypothetical protein U0491_03555 [Candidatus Saccharimonadales bacterium]